VAEPPLVQLLELGLPQGGDGQGLQVQQLRGGGVLLGEDEVAERDREDGLRLQPAVGDDLDEVLGGERLKDGHREADLVLLLDLGLHRQEAQVNEVSALEASRDVDIVSGKFFVAVAMMRCLRCASQARRELEERLEFLCMSVWPRTTSGSEMRLSCSARDI
jgi:hypothetical protein